MDDLDDTSQIRSSKHHNSTNTDKEDIIKSIEAGMNGHLIKPFNPQNLFTIIYKYTNKKL